MILCNSRRGYTLGSGVLFFAFFLMMGLIAAGLVGGVLAYFGNGFDFRQKDANALFDEVKNCFDRENFFEIGLDENPDFFYEVCRIHRQSIEGDHLVYIKRVSDGREFYVGIRDYLVRCDLEARFNNLDLPLCVNYSYGDYEFVVGSSQDSRRVTA